MGLERVVEQIKRNKSFLITSHVNLEGDALGSELAMKMLLEYLDKKAIIVNEGKRPAEYNFLAGINNIKKPQELKNKTFDAFLVLDCSDLGRCKEIAESVEKNIITINIDHHVSNNKFGDVNWVDPHASSTSEMIYRLYQKMGIPLDTNKALCLYVGILTDTGSFRYPNTTSKSLLIAAHLMQYNLEVNKIYRNIYENISLLDAQLLAKIFTTMRADSQGKIIWFVIKRDLLKAKKVSIDLTEHVLNFGRLIKEAEVVILFKESLPDKRLIRVNLRSKNLDVNKIAKMFGGGGHKNASGATLKGSLENVQRLLINKLKQQLSRP